MVPTIQMLILLLVIVASVAVAAARLKIPPAILLVLTGVALALIPGLPTLQLSPELVLLLVLPPVIYSSAVTMSWREFQFNLRPISLLAVGCVVFTTIAVAAVTHWLLGMPWSVGFLLGAIVSPPDVMAPLSIARRMHLPRRLLVILQGEELANDATALILYRFAVGAVSLGAFSFGQAAATFAAIAVGEILWGVGVGWLMLRLRRWVNDPHIEIVLSILTPFIAYWPPEHLGGSGVLATVATGLHVSWYGPMMISATTRIQGVFFWDFFIYMIEGMVFLITGLQARTLIARIGDYSMSELVHFRCGGQRCSDNGALRLDVSRNVSPAVAVSPSQAPGSVAVLAVAILAGVHRGQGHRLACGGARDPACNRERSAISLPRPDSLPHFCGHLSNAGRSRFDAAVGDPGAWPCHYGT